MKSDKTEEEERRMDGEGDSLTRGFSCSVVLLLCNCSSIEDVTQGVKWKVAAELYEAACLTQPLTLCAAGIFRCCWHVAQLAAELSGLSRVDRLPLKRTDSSLKMGGRSMEVIYSSCDKDYDSRATESLPALVGWYRKNWTSSGWPRGVADTKVQIILHLPRYEILDLDMLDGLSCFKSYLLVFNLCITGMILIFFVSTSPGILKLSE